MRTNQAVGMLLVVVVAIAWSALACGQKAHNEALAWELVSLLDHEDSKIADQAWWDLYKLGEDAAPALVSLLRDDCSGISSQANALLDALEGQGILHYVDALSDANPRVRSAAAIRLALLGLYAEESDETIRTARAAIPQLLTLLNDDDTDGVQHAGSALANLLRPGDEQHIPTISAAMRSHCKRFSERTEFGGTLYHLQPAYALAAIGPGALPALREALENPLPELREAAMAGLRRMGPDAAPAVPDLIAIIRYQLIHGSPEKPKFQEEADLLESIDAEPSYPDLFDASRALGACGEAAAEAVPVLVEWIDNPNNPQRWQAIEALERIGPAAKLAVPSLVRLLVDDSVSALASKALTNIGEVAIPDLLHALRNPDTKIGAVRALGRLSDVPSEAPALIHHCFETSTGPDKCEAAAALWQIGHIQNSVLNTLADQCPDKREALRNPGAGAAQAVPELIARLRRKPSNHDYAFALAKLGDDAIPALIDAVRDENPDVRKEALWTLGETNGNLDPAIAVITSALHDPEESVRYAAGHALRRAGSKAASEVAEIVQIFSQEEDPYLWSVLLGTLQTMPEEAELTVPALERALDSESFSIRFQADRALQRIMGND